MYHSLLTYCIQADSSTDMIGESICQFRVVGSDLSLLFYF